MNIIYRSLLEEREQKSQWKIRDARLISAFITGDLVFLQIVTQWKKLFLMAFSFL
jgi:hypothetical protein